MARQHTVEIGDGGWCRLRIAHHLHGQSGGIDEGVQRRHGQHRVQDLSRAHAGHADQTLGMGSRWEIGVGQHDVVAMPHRRQGVEQVGAEQGR